MKWSVHHVNLQAYDVVQTASFYRDTLKLELGKPHSIGSGSSTYNVAPDQLSIVGDGNRGLHVTKPKFDQIRRTGFPINASMGGHVALSLPDLDAVVKRLDAAGIFYVDAGEHAMRGIRQIYLYDPSGNMLELNNDVKIA